MPNWCSNRVTVIGPRADVEQFIADAKGPDRMYWQGDGQGPAVASEFSLPALVPPPPELLATLPYQAEHDTPEGILALIGRGPIRDGYTWQVRQWGTKWNVEVNCPIEIESLDNDRMQVIYDLSTAWSPISPAVRTIAQQRPTLTVQHEYIEEGNAFSGKDVWENGQRTIHEEGDAGVEAVRAYYRISEAEAREYLGLNETDEETRAS
jgi:hypothetical protein